MYSFLSSLTIVIVLMLSFVTTFPQSRDAVNREVHQISVNTPLPNSGNAFTEMNKMSQADGFIFDGPVATKSPNKQQRSITSTTISTTTTTTQPEEFNRCITNCPVTYEYNPVCGTDNVDYTNPRVLDCAQKCGKEVTLNNYGPCSTGRSG